jgi:hypothetical protein
MQPSKPLKISEESRIREPYAWNRTDRYAPPDFEAFFPDDAEGGKQLDDLFGGKLGGSHEAGDVFAVVRRGLRHTTRHPTLILAEIGKGFVWGVKDQDLRAIELLYHASDSPRTKHYAMYHGLTVVNQRSDNLIRTLMQRYTTYDQEIQRRILWGFRHYGDHEDTRERLTRLLDDPNGLKDSAIVAALDLYREFTGEPYPDLSGFDDVGLFAIGFESEGLETREQLRSQLVEWVGDEKAIAEFVVRIAGGKAVGVGLIRGVVNRDRIVETIETAGKSELTFSETFAPVVLRRRQLREFAKFLPEGLPSGARPAYAPLPADEKFAWNATDGYEPPDFSGYFPDHPEAGAELDRLYEGRDSLELTAREILEKIRRGLRHSTLRKNVLMSWTSTVCGWPADPMAREIAYHAADPKADQEMRYNAVYFGLSGWWDKSENVLRLFAEILATEPRDRSLGNGLRARITWSFRNKEEEKRFVAVHLAGVLENHADYSVEKLATLSSVYEQLAGEKPPRYDKYRSRGYFVVMFRHTRSNTPEELRRVATARFGANPDWLDVVAYQSKSEPQAMAVVRGLGGTEWLTRALQQAKGFSVDFAAPITDLDPEAIEKYGLEKYRTEAAEE